jgi:transposase
MPKQQKTYTKEFKLEAVQLVKSSGKPMSQIARELGVSDTALYHWCKQLTEQGEQAFAGSGHQTAEQEEIRRLKRELDITRQERDILKRAMPLRGTTANEQGYTGEERSQRQDGIYA